MTKKNISLERVNGEPDGLPEPIPCDELLEMEFEKETPEAICEQCGNPDYDCECGLVEADGGRLREYFEIVKARHDLERQAEESGEFTSAILSDSDSTFQSIAAEAARTVGVPETLTVISVLSAISAAIGKCLSVESKPNRQTSLGLYVQGFARSGTGKTESAKITFSPLYRKQRDLALAWEDEAAETELHLEISQAQLKRLMGKKGKPSAEDAQEMLSLKKEIKKLDAERKSGPVIWTGDATLAAMRDLLEANACQLSFVSDDSGKALQNLLGEHSNLKMPEDNILLGCYSGSDIAVDRSSIGRIFLTECWGSLFWLAQPDKLQLLTGSQWLQEGGFICRCLIARFDCVPHVMPDDSVSGELLEEYYEKWDRIFEAYRQNYLESGERKSIKPDKDARARMKEWESHIVGLRLGNLSDVDSFAARWIENTWRLAGVLHVAKHLDRSHIEELELSEVEAAIKMMDKFFIPQQLALMSENRETAQQKRLAKLTTLCERHGGEITLRHLRKNGHNADDMLAFARNNPKSFEIIEEKSEKGGRPSVKIKALLSVVDRQPATVTKTAKPKAYLVP